MLVFCFYTLFCMISMRVQVNDSFIVRDCFLSGKNDSVTSFAFYYRLCSGIFLPRSLLS